MARKSQPRLDWSRTHAPRRGWRGVAQSPRHLTVRPRRRRMGSTADRSTRAAERQLRGYPKAARHSTRAPSFSRARLRPTLAVRRRRACAWQKENSRFKPSINSPSEPANWIEQMPRSVAAISIASQRRVGASIANSGSGWRRGDICRASFQVAMRFSRKAGCWSRNPRHTWRESHCRRIADGGLSWPQPAGIGVLARGDFPAPALKRLCRWKGLCRKRLAEPLERDRLIEMLFDVAADLFRRIGLCVAAD